MWKSGSVVHSTSSAPHAEDVARCCGPTSSTARAGIPRLSPGRWCPRCRGWRAFVRLGCRQGAMASPDAGIGIVPTTHAPIARPSAVAVTKCLLNDQQLGAAVGQVVLDLRPHRGGVDRHAHGADPAAAEECFQQLGAVRAHQRDAVAALDAGGTQRAGAPRRDLGRVAVRPARARNRAQRPRREARGAVAQHRRQGALGRRQLHLAFSASLSSLFTEVFGRLSRISSVAGIL